MDVKYRSEEWEKTKDRLHNLIGLGVWGKGMIDELKHISDNLEKVRDEIASEDEDGVISFSYQNNRPTYQSLYEDFQVLESFSGKVGDIVVETIDQPFYEDLDKFIQTVRDATISNYTTGNRIGAVDVHQVPYSYTGAYSEYETPKSEVTIEDLFNGDNYYAEEMKKQFADWELANPDEAISYSDFQQAAANSRAFEYESIEDNQLTKEFWVNIAAAVVTIGVTVICPPAGMALVGTYALLEGSSAISGEDWISGRELGSTERIIRGVLAPLNLVGMGAASRSFAGTVRSADNFINLGRNASKAEKATKLRTTEVPDNVLSMKDYMARQGRVREANLTQTAAEQTRVRELKLLDAKAAGADNIPYNSSKLDDLPSGNVAPFAGVKGSGNSGTVSGIKGTGDVSGSIAGEKPGFSSTKLFDEKFTGDIRITEIDRKKLEGWNFRPSDEMYLKYKETYDNPKFYNQENGDINWPPNNGFEGEPIIKVLEEGTIIDRYGNPSGTFVSPAGIPYEQRALALHSDNAPYHVYEITEPFNVEAGKIAPWFDRPGGGTQFFTGNVKILDDETGEMVEGTVENLKRLGYIREINQ